MGGSVVRGWFGKGRPGVPDRRWSGDFPAECELLPQHGNRVSLAEEKDRYVLPVADFSYTQCENDRQVIQAARGVMENILRAAGATEVITIERYVHLVVGCRMAADAKGGASSTRISGRSPYRIC
jgi:hypothetical protein